MAMPLTTMKTIGDKEVSFRELTAAEIRDLLKKAENDAKVETISQLDIGNLLFQDVSFNDIMAMSDLKKAEVYSLSPSQLRIAADACKECNEYFFEMVERLKTAMEKTLKTLDIPKNQDQKQSKSLSAH